MARTTDSRLWGEVGDRETGVLGSLAHGWPQLLIRGPNNT